MPSLVLRFFRLAAAAAIVCALAARGWAQPGGHAASDHAAAPNGAPAQGGAAPAHDSPAHGGAGHGGDHARVSPMPVDPDLAIFTAVIFLLLLLVLWKFAWGPISKALDERERRIEEQIAAAQKSHDEAKALLAEYERKLAAAQAEVRGILEEARRDAEHTRQEIVAQARADALLERDRALREIATATDQALKELAERSAHLAIDLAARIVRAELKPADHARLIEEAVASFPRAGTSHN